MVQTSPKPPISISINMPMPICIPSWDAPKSSPLQQPAQLQGINHGLQRQESWGRCRQGLRVAALGKETSWRTLN